MLLLLTLHKETSAAAQVSRHSGVLSLFAVIHIVDDQLVRLAIRQHAVVFARLQLCVLEHPFDWDVIL